MTERCWGAPPQFPSVPIVQPSVETVPPTRLASPAVAVPLKTATGWVLSTTAAEGVADAEGAALASGLTSAGLLGSGLDGWGLVGSGAGDAAALLPTCSAETAIV